MLEAIALLSLLGALISDAATFASWRKLKDGRLVGFRAMRYDVQRHCAVSGADKRQRVTLRCGEIHSMTGRGFFLTHDPQHAIDYYAHHDHNILLAYAFEVEDVTSGSLMDRETEISVSRGELLGYLIGDPEEED